jgi:hypothetical protein
MNNEQDTTRRCFLNRIALAGFGALGVRSLISAAARGADAKPKPMRLDVHIHVPNRKAIRQLADYAAHDGITHYVALLDHLELIGELKKTVTARCIPFQRIRKPLEHPVASLAESAVAGYKIHLRHPMTRDRDGAPIAAGQKHLGKICEAAGKLGRPILFHSDADEPDICSLPMLAELARRYPETTIIAAHWGMYSQEYQAVKSTPPQWEAKLPAAVPQNVQLLLEVKNLYADVALLGRDFPERSANPDFKLKLIEKELSGLKPAQRQALSKKLFIGTDFPAFRDKNDPKIGYLYQLKCIRQLFKDEYDEDQTARGFLKLLPAAFAA